MFTLRFELSDVPYWAARYFYPREETELLEQRQAVQAAGKVSKALLHSLAKWKSPRRAADVDKNSEQFVCVIRTLIQF
jgi:hypothetical protein